MSRYKNAPVCASGKVTLDGEPATITLPVQGIGTVRQMNGPKYLKADRDQLAAILKSGGQFQSPRFARTEVAR